MEAAENESNEPKWTVISRVERRVLGVLVEKAKTTPANYPLSLNALRTGSNQKSNRFPTMDLEETHVEDAIDSLRKRGAVSIIQGDSRVEKYRHLAYDWLGVDKVELAVMAELLLRGAQTVGELRGRAARMEPIKGMSELTPILDSLVQKNLVQYLTPRGRGAVVTHCLYEPQELDKVKREFGGAATAAPSAAAPAPAPVPTPVPAPAQDATPPAQPADAQTSTSVDWQAELTLLRAELSEQIAELRAEVDDLKQQING